MHTWMLYKSTVNWGCEGSGRLVSRTLERFDNFSSPCQLRLITVSSGAAVIP